MKESDLLAVTSSITESDIINAYEAGIFPWPFEEENLIPWCSPDPRGILDFKDFHISKSNLKTFKKQDFQVTFCSAFDDVMNFCAEVPRKNQSGTWITEEIKNSYSKLFKLKKAYSVEVYKEKNLVGGMYGVISSTYLSGESMFHLETGASKFALTKLIEKLITLNVSWIDTQMVTPLVASFGGKEITKKDFLSRLEKGKILESNFFERLST